MYNKKIMFSKKECNDIINLSKLFEIKNSNVYFKNENEIKYNVWNISKNKNTQWIFDRMFDYFTNTTGIEITKQINILHLHNYKIGNKFIKHRDNQYPGQLHNIGVCLNDDYEGGEFVLYEPEEVLPKKQGEIYTFPSLRMHEVKEITSGERWSIISFLYVENLNIKKLGIL